jgi:hypothetical protein
VSYKVGPESQYESKIRKWACRVFKDNRRNFEEAIDEVMFELFMNKKGQLHSVVSFGGLTDRDVMGTEEVPKGFVRVASVHNHPGSFAEESVWDEDEGQRIANEQGRDYYMYVVGLDENDSNLVMKERVFYPESSETEE